MVGRITLEVSCGLVPSGPLPPARLPGARGSPGAHLTTLRAASCLAEGLSAPGLGSRTLLWLEYHRMEHDLALASARAPCPSAARQVVHVPDGPGVVWLRSGTFADALGGAQGLGEWLLSLGGGGSGAGRRLPPRPSPDQHLPHYHHRASPPPSSSQQYPSQALDRKEEWEKDKTDLATVYRRHKLEQEIDRALAEKRAREAAAAAAPAKKGWW